MLTSLPTPSDAAVDARRCPLCHGPNACVMAQAPSDGVPQTCAPHACWCTQVTFRAEVLQAVPEAARRRACICQGCATAPAPQPAAFP